jgi:hypothetical protein
LKDEEEQRVNGRVTERRFALGKARDDWREKVTINDEGRREEEVGSNYG